jgi:hypothetical protein
LRAEQGRNANLSTRWLLLLASRNGGWAACIDEQRNETEDDDADHVLNIRFMSHALASPQ